MIKKILNNNFFKNTGIYTIMSIINAAIPFLLMPILTRYLSPEEYGIVSMFSLVVSIVLPFIGLNVDGAISRMYYEREHINLSEYIYNGIMIIVFNSFIMGLIFYIFAEPIAQITSYPEDYLWIVIIYVVCQMIVKIILVLWQVREKAVSYGTFNISLTATNLLLSLIFVVGLSMGWQGRVYGQLIALIIFAIIAIIILNRNKWIKKSYNKEYIKKILKFGLPLIPHSLSNSIISMSDRFFITNMVGVAETGIYTVGHQIGSIINLLATAFNNAYIPWLYERLKKDEYATKVRIVKFTYIYFAALLLIAIVAGIVAPPFLSMFLGDSYSDSSSYVIWVAIGYAFNGMYLMVVNYIFYEQKNSSLAMITFGTAILNIVLNYFFIKAFGAIGAAQASTLIYFIKFVLVWIMSAKVHKMPWLEVFNKNKK